MSSNAAWMRDRIAARVEDIRWLADTGETLTGAAARLGISADAIEKFCGKHDLRPELERLRGSGVSGSVRQGRVGMVLA